MNLKHNLAGVFIIYFQDNMEYKQKPVVRHCPECNEI